MHSLHGRAHAGLYKGILEKIKLRLEGWKTKYLTLMGRKVLAQSILCSIPMYTMQTTLIPKGVCYRIEQLVRKFIWGGSKKEQCCSLIKWDVIVNPNDYGGLGIRKMDKMNLAFMPKLGWRVLTKND